MLTRSQQEALRDDAVTPVCYLGHDDCWDTHDADRRADEADYENDWEEKYEVRP